MKYKVYRTKAFEKEMFKLPIQEQSEIVLFEKKLSENPFVGKPLGLVFFREKKLKGKRVYYLVYDDFVVVLMVAISDKKSQQITIDAVKEKLDEYHNIIKATIKDL